MPGRPTPATRSSRMTCMPWCSRNPEKYWRKIAWTGQNQRDDNISLRCQGLHRLLAFGCAPRTKNYPEKKQNDGICSLFLLSEVNQHQGVPVSPSNYTEKMHPETCSFTWSWWLTLFLLQDAGGLNCEVRDRCEAELFVLLVAFLVGIGLLWFAFWRQWKL